MRAPSGQALSASPTEPVPVSALSGNDPSRLMFHEPTAEELHESCSRKWAVSGPFNIDQWPADVLALSMPTKFVPVTDFDEWWRIYDGDDAVMLKYATALDEAIGFEQHFIRMNSRSPKDAAYPVLPVTCAGKQAMWWIAASERCADDASLHQYARKPFFICAREWRFIRPEFEFRCFARGGDLIAVSRYDYHNPSKVDESAAASIWEAAKRFHGEHLGKHYADVVFDLFAPGTSRELLIELNPYGLSDPCLFRSYEEVEKGGVRLRDSDGSGEADKTGTGLAVGDSAGRDGIAQNTSSNPPTTRGKV